MSKQASEFQERIMSRFFRGKEIFKPLNTGRMDERVSCVREFIANIFFYTKNGVTIMIDAGYNYDRLKEKMGWLDLDPAKIRHILITHQDTDHVGAVETDSDGKFELARALATVFQGRGLTALALAYVNEEGLPTAFFRVPIDPLEAAARRLHEKGYEKVGLWGISKGAELTLTAGSLLPGLINAVVAVAPMNTVCQGFAKEKGISIMPGSAWSFHGEEVPYSSFNLKKFPLRHVLWSSLKAREVTMYDLYIPLVRKPNPNAVIPVEKITGPILLISSQMDTMWPSEPAAKEIMKRLREKKFSYAYRHLSYQYGSHLFVPMELSAAKFFRGDRGKNKEPGRRARMDSLVRTLEFVSQW